MKFLASRLSEGNKLFPAEVHIEQYGIKVRIPSFFSGDTKYINFEDISAVEIDTPFIGFSTIRFFHNGNKVQAHGFTKDDAKNIKLQIDLGRKGRKKEAKNIRNTYGDDDYSERLSPKAEKKSKAEKNPKNHEEHKENFSREFEESNSEPIIQIINESPSVFSTALSSFGRATKTLFDEAQRPANIQRERIEKAKEETKEKVEEIAKISFSNDKEEIINQLQYLLSICSSKPEKTVKNVIIEKMEFGIMKLKNKDANDEIEFFGNKLELLKKKNIFDYLS